MTDNVGMHPGASEFDNTPNRHDYMSASGNYNTSRVSTDAPGCIPTLPDPDAPGCIPTSNQPPYPKRKNIRAEFHDYSGGEYFVTICTRDKEHYFGKIIDGEMRFSFIGEFANNALKALHTHSIPMWKFHCLLLCPIMFMR